MTIVAAVKIPSGVLMGADRLADEGGRREPMAVSKIIETQGVLLGVSGSARWLHRLRHWDAMPRFPYGKVATVKKEGWLNTEFSDALRTLAADTGMLLVSENKGADADLNLLIAWDYDLFVMARNLEVNQVYRDCHTIGSGRDECLGALLALAEQTPFDRLTKALDITAELVTGIGPPFDLAQTQA